MSESSINTLDLRGLRIMTTARSGCVRNRTVKPQVSYDIGEREGIALYIHFANDLATVSRMSTSDESGGAAFAGARMPSFGYAEESQAERRTQPHSRDSLPGWLRNVS